METNREENLEEGNSDKSIDDIPPDEIATEGIPVTEKDFPELAPSRMEFPDGTLEVDGIKFQVVRKHG